ncbi:MAG: HupE/UreJ family protein [Spongiibacteraceae bacterium]|jgi:urease accessory protein|nr:HupE/UreJ family protein [Spongiibacteraceae bacterium]
MSLPAQRRPGLALLVLLASGAALAHQQSGLANGFATGFLHPILGLDHLLAMVAVGLWGAFLGQPAIWLLPVTFPLVMAVGGVVGILGPPLPGVEIGIAASAVALGAMVVLAVRPPLWVAALLVGAFALCHGHAHGTELPEATGALTYSLGFVIATGTLHLAGIALGLLVHWPVGAVAVRAGGALIAAAGIGFLIRAL